MLQEIMQKFSHKNIINIYPYGSRVYGTNSETSDYDFIVECDSQDEQLSTTISDKSVDLTFWSKESFKRLLEEHEVSIIETQFSQSMTGIKHSFVLDATKLRNSFSEKASNSFVKCKKNL